MYFGICHLGVVPVRSSASDKSEMVTQLLFGEVVEIMDKKGSWRRIRCTWDNYFGWIDHKQIMLIPPSEAARYQEDFSFSLDLLQPIIAKEHYVPIPMAARLPLFDGLRLHILENTYQFSGQAVAPNHLPASAALVLKIARKYLYAPYQWGGRSPLGIDCSGLTQNVFQMVGVRLPRDAYQQVECGELIDFIEQASAGDLAFFENRNNRITHVGILCSDTHILHASGQVRIDRIDHYGIFNENLQKYTHRLRVIKRVLPPLSARPLSQTDISVPESRQVGLF